MAKSLYVRLTIKFTGRRLKIISMFSFCKRNLIDKIKQAATLHWSRSVPPNDVSSFFNETTLALFRVYALCALPALHKTSCRVLAAFNWLNSRAFHQRVWKMCVTAREIEQSSKWLGQLRRPPQSSTMAKRFKISIYGIRDIASLCCCSS